VRIGREAELTFMTPNRNGVTPIHLLLHSIPKDGTDAKQADDNEIFEGLLVDESLFTQEELELIRIQR
jgi:hypothetical protein